MLSYGHMLSLLYALCLGGTGVFLPEFPLQLFRRPHQSFGGLNAALLGDFRRRLPLLQMGQRGYCLISQCGIFRSLSRCSGLLRRLLRGKGFTFLPQCLQHLGKHRGPLAQLARTPGLPCHGSGLLPEPIPGPLSIRALE